ncbi:hypothetical protein SAMD00079811_23850 [Scytonema sp. HK-05]|uniref:hypothetical protein n=1 Tax=Scytonema sp. HK-05 TaxID=1137095 RepID=UPI0009379AC5|nr:hypothetical protein [Scytonema sp. HK-05]OKH60425.1 hypothetical protein NIES2130_03235 [Scytonema sp. HK-05]BAY44783.1 hypothetical protein SAMD00079811_23850 [Scytonema sp. HK-05]
MSRLKVVDLSFFETELPSDNQVHGGLAVGLTVNSPTSSVSTFAASDSSSGSNVTYSFNPATGAYSYNIGYGYKYAVAGAAAGAAGNGPTYSTTYTNASAS